MQRCSFMFFCERVERETFIAIVIILTDHTDCKALTVICNYTNHSLIYMLKNNNKIDSMNYHEILTIG